MRVNIHNPKEHFILHDSLNNITQDLTYSIFKKYNCKAGCKICYIRDDFLPDAKFKQYVPIVERSEQKRYLERLQEFFSYFHTVATIDDMWFVKNDHPEHYRFYLEHAEMFHLSSMTDNAIFRHLPLIEDELRVKGLREISISEPFLYLVNHKKLLDAFDRIHAKAKISKIKVILHGREEESIGTEMRSNSLVSWCLANDVMLEKQREYGQTAETSPEVLKQLANTRYSDIGDFTEDTTYSEHLTNLYPIHSEALFLMYDDFYSELKSATAEGYSKPFAKLTDFDDPIHFLAKVLEGKLIDYRRYAEAIEDKENTYCKYFQYVADHLEIHPDFNFIPRVALRPFSTYYEKLKTGGVLTDTAYGLVDASASIVVPIYTFKDHEQQ